MEFLLHVLVAAGLFVAIDAVWLGLVAPKFYRKHIGKILADKPNFVAAAVFYALYIVGVVVFAINPALDEDSLQQAMGLGALLGLVMYATYDLTNQATLKVWSTKVSVVDMAWGAFITGIVSTLTFLIFS
ncbi:MAG: DUF2177 family protein [Candidatus Saccharimonadales bacterium]